MKIQVTKSANYIGWIVIIVAFAFLYFSYFFIYIPNQEAKLQQRAFRILKEYGNNMFGKNNYYQNHFKNYGLYYKIRYFSNTAKIQQNDSLKKTKNTQLADVQNVIDGLLSYVQLESATQATESIFSYSEKESKLFVDYSLQISEATNPAAINSVKNLYIPVSGQQNGTIDSLLKTSVKFKVPVDILMQGLKFDRLFENIVLFDDSLVYYNSNFDLVADITNPKALCDSVLNVQGGVWETISIRGEDKHVMILPLDFWGKRFYVAGLIIDKDFRDKTRTINSQVLILVAAILLLIFIGMPILKIIFIDEKERLKALDASGSAISTIFGSGLLVLIVIGVIKHEFVDNALLEKRIATISDSLYSHVDSDINSIKELYVSFIDSSRHQSKLSRKVRTQFETGNKKFYQLTGDTLDSPFPLNEIILINPTGIVDKAVTRTPFSEVVPLDLSARNYFTQAVDKSKTWPSKNNVHFYIESIKSYNTGKGETAFSFHNTKNEWPPVTAITSAVPSFYNQVLPKDIEYLIINGKGKVLYHSIKAKNLHENFIDECKSNPKLMRAIELRTADIIQIKYNEKKWMIRIVPLNETPLFHITLLDMGQTDNKNARIFLFTFYFLFVSLVFVGLGMLVMRWIIPSENLAKKPEWFLNWLYFQGKNFRYYIYLSLIFIGIIIVQYSGILFLEKPVSVLVYQLIFIIYSSFVSLIFLNRKELKLKHLLLKKYYPENIILSAAIFITIVLLLRFNPGWPVFIPLGILLLFTIKIPRILRFIERLPKLPDRYIHMKTSHIKRSYLLFIFLWLCSISVVPVVQYYFSIKYQEEQFWKQDQLFSVAIDNLDLKKNYPGEEHQEWFKKIQGNGLDNLKIEYVPDSKIKSPQKSTFKYNDADFIYSLFPDPVSKDYGIKNNSDDSVFIKEWFVNDTTLIYSKGGTEGTVQITSKTKLRSNMGEWFISIFITFSLIAIGAWILLKYIATVILNLTTNSAKDSDISWWETAFENTEIKRILLHSFNGPYFLRKSKEYLNDSEREKNRFGEIETINASQLLLPDFNYTTFLSGERLIWVSGFDQSIYEIDKHELLLQRIQEICRKAEGKVIVDLPFDLESIDEFYDDFISENEINQEKQTQIYLLKKRWKTTFKNFFEFNGYLNHKAAGITLNSNLTLQIKGKKTRFTEWEIEDNETQFSNIWDSLTGYEKIALYDLADDGLLNRKNKMMIQRLIDKKLILPEPYPRLFSEDFRDFVNQSLEPSDVKAIEKKLGLKGKWKNIQYLILLILIPLATFILISQGISVEKIFGIFAGALTVITGVMRLFDNRMTRQSSS